MTEDTKQRILRVLEEAYPKDLSIREVSMKAGMSHYTASMYLKILVAEGKVEFSREVGKAKFYKVKKPRRS